MWLVNSSVLDDSQFEVDCWNEERLIWGCRLRQGDQRGTSRSRLKFSGRKESYQLCTTLTYFPKKPFFCTYRVTRGPYGYFLMRENCVKRTVAVFSPLPLYFSYWYVGWWCILIFTFLKISCDLIWCVAWDYRSAEDKKQKEKQKTNEKNRKWERLIRFADAKVSVVFELNLMGGKQHRKTRTARALFR